MSIRKATIHQVSQKSIPESINGWLSSILSNNASSNKAILAYQESIDDSGYNYKLKYKPPPKETSNNNPSNKHHRKKEYIIVQPPIQ
jgi:hypothetical protein